MTTKLEEAAEETPGEVLVRLGMDGSKWSQEFIKILKRINAKIEDIDESYMLGWFCNSIMAGYDEGYKRGANWQRENYPTCESCKYWRDYSCQNGNVTDYVNAEDLVAFTFDVGEDFGCCLHEEKEKLI